jgi:AcrR family transcriptional regulator
VVGAVIAAAFLPARTETAAGKTQDELIAAAAQRLPAEIAGRRDLPSATLELLADAGMSSLAFSGVATRAGISTATLHRYWESRIDTIIAAIAQIFETYPIPDTGDLRADLTGHLHTLGRVLVTPRAQAVIGVLVAAAAGEPQLERALHDRLVAPRHAQFAARIQRGVDEGQATGGLAPAVAADVLTGPLYFRALITGEPIDDALIDTIVDLVLQRPLSR